MFGYLDPNSGTGHDIGALSDTMWEFDSSCGKCFQVKCRPASFTDGYGQFLDRSGVCYDESKVVTIRITDACPCHYPNNAYSNKRWCCGDMPHIDLSDVAFAKLADTRWGVMGIQYQEVECPSGTPYTPDHIKYNRNRAGRMGETY